MSVLSILRRPRVAIPVVASVALLSSQIPSRSAQLVANYLDGAGEGFNDPTLGADRQTAFEYALGLWSAVLGDAFAGEQIVVDAVFDPLGGSPTSATLGFAGPLGSGFVSGNPLGGNVFFPGSLRNHLSGSDVVGGSEVTSTFNSDVDGNVVLGSTVFYYGTDDNAPTGTTDFVSTALHEIGHGLGWSGSLDVNSASGGYGDYINGSFINAYDHFVERTSDGAALSGLSSADRIAAFTGDDISWGGALATAANSGVEPALYAPNPSIPGSSYSHLDETAFPLELMSPEATSGTGHTLSPLTLAVLEDQGWSIVVPVPEPGSGALLLFSVVGLVAVRRRRLKTLGT